MTLSRKIYVFSGVFLLIILAVSSLGIYAMQKISFSYDDILKNPVTGKQYAQGAKEHFSDAAGYFTSYNLVTVKDPDIIENFKDEIEEATDSIEAVKKAALAEEKKKIEDTEALMKDFSGLFKLLVDAKENKGALSAEDQKRRQELEDNVKGQLLSIAALEDKKITKSVSDTESLKKKIDVLLFLGMVVGLVIGVILTISIIKGVVPPIKKISGIAGQIADGDLRVVIDHNGKDEIGMLSNSMRSMVDSFNSMIGKTSSATRRVVEMMDIVKETSAQTEDGARKQSEQAAFIATSAEEMSNTINAIAKNASLASQTSAEAMDTAAKGKEVADGAVETVNRVYNSTVELATMVDKLGSRTAEIGGIVTVIKEIADQTNLLALNAAIEAARAGEQGRGFAVVADEVRKLAERTVKATVEITDKINAVQAESDLTTKSMSQASNEVTTATEFIKQVGTTLDTIVGSVRNVRDQITQIAAAVEEQSAASEEVANNIETTLKIAKDMHSVSKNMMDGVEGLTKITDDLTSSIERFKTRESDA